MSRPDRTKALAVIGAMQCVADSVETARLLSPTDDLREVSNRCRASVSSVVAKASNEFGKHGKAEEASRLTHEAVMILNEVDVLPKRHPHPGVEKHLNFARQAVPDLKAALKLYL